MLAIGNAVLHNNSRNITTNLSTSMTLIVWQSFVHQSVSSQIVYWNTTKLSSLWFIKFAGHNDFRGCTPNLVNIWYMAEFLQEPRPSSLVKTFRRSFCNHEAQQESHLRKDCPNLNTTSMNGTCSDHVSYKYTTKAAGTGMEIYATFSHTTSLKGIVCSQAVSL